MENAYEELLLEQDDSTARPWPRRLMAGLATCALCCLLVSMPGAPSEVPGQLDLGVDTLDASVAAKKGPDHRLPQSWHQAAAAANSSGSGLHPVIMMHGALKTASDFDQVKVWISRRHPGTRLLAVEMYEGADSLQPLAEQVLGLSHFLERLVEDYEEFAGGYNLLCHSQGAVICRALCEAMPNHRALSLVSLAGPQMGVYGSTWLEHAEPFFEAQIPMPKLPDFPLPIPGLGEVKKAAGSVAKGSFYQLAYTSMLQSVSLANLWHDPLHVESYLRGNVFLPLANGETAASSKSGYRSNFLRLQKATFLVGAFTRQTYDSPLGVEPWQSGVFGFYANGSSTKVEPIEKQDVFAKDSFGLRTLHETGRLHLEAVEGIGHQEWLTSETVFVKHVMPHLV
mmetsp:Transcript_80862/g.142630  ORF Transcript_80862/g.142630 Transcript_80862/m.142630 type:complete len:397 (-) Transcript_80862:87-1277(-)